MSRCATSRRSSASPGPWSSLSPPSSSSGSCSAAWPRCHRAAQPYFIVVMVGQLAWQLFANTLGNTSASLVGSAQLISKVYFPRLIVPLSTVLVALHRFHVRLRDLRDRRRLDPDVAGDPRALAPLLHRRSPSSLAVGAGLWLVGPHRPISRLPDPRPLAPADRRLRDARRIPDRLPDEASSDDPRIQPHDRRSSTPSGGASSGEASPSHGTASASRSSGPCILPDDRGLVFSAAPRGPSPTTYSHE
jgi:hypothetical protein